VFGCSLLICEKRQCSIWRSLDKNELLTVQEEVTSKQQDAITGRLIFQDVFIDNELMVHNGTSRKVMDSIPIRDSDFCTGVMQKLIISNNKFFFCFKFQNSGKLE
jgi:hypothetical protein